MNPWIAILALFTVVVLAFAAWQIRDVQRIKREMEENNRKFHYLTDPMMAYVDTLEAIGKPYTEEGFQAFLREQRGEEGTQEYLTFLRVEHAMLTTTQE